MIRHMLLGTAAALAVGLATPACAAPETETNGRAPPAAVPAPRASAPVEASDSRVLTDLEMRDARGGEGIIVTNQTLTAITNGNILAGGYTAGAVSLSDNALSGFNGVGNLLINTGAQNSLQTGMNLTINVGR